MKKREILGEKGKTHVMKDEAWRKLFGWKKTSFRRNKNREILEENFGLQKKRNIHKIKDEA